MLTYSLRSGGHQFSFPQLNTALYIEICSLIDVCFSIFCIHCVASLTLLLISLSCVVLAVRMLSLFIKGYLTWLDVIWNCQLLFFFNTAYRLVFTIRSLVLSNCFYFILVSFFLFLYTGQLLVHFVPCCILPDCCKLHCIHCIYILNYWVEVKWTSSQKRNVRAHSDCAS